MFQIGFWEVILVLVVALIVFGPERLPGLARVGGRLVRRTRQFIDSLKYD